MMKSANVGRAWAAPEPKNFERTSRYVNAREVVHEAEDQGKAWRIASGAVRLDLVIDGLATFAGISLAGDTLGAEVAEQGHYAFTARALVPTSLVATPCLASTGGQLAHQKRMAAMLALRCGSADERVVRLLDLLAPSSSQLYGADEAHDGPTVCVPFLRDMAEITDLTVESVSRSLNKLRRDGVLRHGATGKKMVTLHSDRFFQANDRPTKCTQSA